MSTNYSKHVNPRQKAKVAPQSEAVPGKTMAKNNAGGFVFELDPWKKLDRFLILGTENNTYYSTSKNLTVDNAKNLEDCIKLDGNRVVSRIVEISREGRAPKNDPALFALAMCASVGSEETRKAALAALSDVARTGTHLMHFVEFAQAFRGWGRALRRAVGNWYNNKSVPNLTYQLMKYKSRDGWSNRDLLRLSHPKTTDEVRNVLYKWTVKPENVDLNAQTDKSLMRLAAAEKVARETNSKNAVSLIKEYELPREVVNTVLLNDSAVWQVLLEDMPVTAMVRNLGKMTAVGLLKPLSFHSKKVVETLTNEEAIRKSKIHPLALLVAQRVYSQGRGDKGSLTWVPDQNIVDALDEAFYLAFKNVVPTGKRFYLGLDISGSMTMGDIAGMPGVTPNIAAAAMAMVTLQTEKNCYVAGFTNGTGKSMHAGYGSALTPLEISKKKRLDAVARYMTTLPFGGTDCALPMLDALEKKMEVDTFVIYTDNETWSGAIHPFQALKKYRDKMGIPAKLVVVGMTTTGFTIADPSDAGMLDCVGFDTATPEIIATFSKE
jgi:60 kDa SS-A/Ro ribonucleoprotein